jgi:hypothetical protein
MKSQSITLGIIVENQGFFPAHLCDTGHKEIPATTVQPRMDTDFKKEPAWPPFIRVYPCPSVVND